MAEQQLATIDTFRKELHAMYFKQITNFFSDQDKAIKFMSAVVYSVQKTPKLLECDRTSLFNAFMTCAEFGFMPSTVSGECYVLPYNNKNGMTAQFQLGYQGLVTLFYRAGIRSIAAEIVRAKDKFTLVNGVIEHTPDVFSDDRGEPIGAYVVVELQAGGKVYKVMNKKEILDIGKKFSKSYYKFDHKTNKKTDEVGDYTPWNEKNDPELWMWKKTVLKQVAKLVPKNETIYKAFDLDNKDSVIGDRMDAAMNESEGLKMGKLLNGEKTPDNEPTYENEETGPQAPDQA